MAETTAQEQRTHGPGKPFEKGQSGNPNGRPPGARNRATILAEQLMQDDVEGVVRAVIGKARSGDMAAARLVLDRILPPRKGRPISFPLPEIETAAHVTQALGVVASLMADGEITPDEASAVAGVIETKRKAIETQELEQRVAALEAQGQK
jgi:hypothetical protein